ncbi:MAG: hypothetical protein J6Z50_03270 [Fibrobacterales bacterium]|nr:hypothetical protein [Fibrobacterales bacterium]MBP5188132.1 hypothetical protein [Fibrobacterales bacterium]MBP5351594.1 hypothetical protein [Fibrobacterales bacterium]
MAKCAEMTATEMRTYLEEQKQEMLRHKWIESERAGHDLGQACMLDWIKVHAEGFRRDFTERMAREKLEKAGDR